MHAMTEHSLERLAYFVAVAEAGSFETAGETLNLAPEVLSEAFDQLERELDVTLALRTMRTVRLTRAGKAALEAASATLSGLAEIPDEAGIVPHVAPICGSIAIVLPSEPATHWLPSRLVELRRDHPNLAVHVHAVDGTTPLRDSGFEVGVRCGYQLPGVISRSESLRLMLAARNTPAIDVTRLGVVVKDAPMLAGRHSDIAAGRDPGTGQVRPLQAEQKISVSHRDAAIAMARNGLGVVLATEAALAHDFATGSLIPVLPDWDFGSLSLSVALRDEAPSLAARAVADALCPTAPKRRRGALYLP